MYTERLYHDSYVPDSRTAVDLEAQHSIIYVLTGSVSVDGVAVGEESALYCRDVFSVEAGPEGAVVWRWELVRTEAPNNLARGYGVSSRLRMSRRIRMFELVPTSKWLFRLDGIYDYQGTTARYSHPGSGIRCLLAGHLRVESDKGECSDNSLTGDCWYEEGSYPTAAACAPGETADFLRGLVLPPEYAHSGDTATWIAGQEAGRSSWKNHVQTVVTLL